MFDFRGRQGKGAFVLGTVEPDEFLAGLIRQAQFCHPGQLRLYPEFLRQLAHGRFIILLVGVDVPRGTRIPE